MASLYTATLVVLHALGYFPAPGPYDPARLIGSPCVSFEGTVVHFPTTRWGQTRFLLEGSAQPLEAFHGRTVVNLKFPIDDLAPGERVRARGWLTAPRPPSRRRAFDERHYWAGFRAFAILHVADPAAFERLDPPEARSWEQRAWAYHQRFKRFWYDRLPEDEAALLSCMTMGSRGILPLELKNQCIRAGVYHILVVSGQNMALIIATGVVLLRFFKIPRRCAFWACILPIAFYVYAVGADPPVFRAAVMAGVVLAAMAIGRDTPRYYPFVLAWLWVLLREPEALFGASFQLSFAATASLMILLPVLRVFSRWRSRLWRWLAEAGTMSLAVHLGIWPLQLYYFHQISLAGLVANWTVFPLAGCIMVSGLFLGIWGVAAPETLPYLALLGMHQVLVATLSLIQRLSDWRWASIPLPCPSPAACVVYYAVLIGILMYFRNRQRYGKKTIPL